MPLYKGDITFKVNTLNGDCSYLVAETQSAKPSYYYINTSSKTVMITKVGGEQKFKMKFTSTGLLQENMLLTCSLLQNADIGDTVYGSGTLSY